MSSICSTSVTEWRLSPTDDRVTLLAPSEQITTHGRQRLKGVINGLTPGGWTDLAGGWLEGCREIAAHPEQQGVNRALLLTDGLANRGITDIEELTHHARQLRQRGVATSTFGVGLDFNEHLLEGLATEGGGYFYFMERPDQIPQMFQRELGELLTVIVMKLCLHSRCYLELPLSCLGISHTSVMVSGYASISAISCRRGAAALTRTHTSRCVGNHPHTSWDTGLCQYRCDMLPRRDSRYSAHLPARV